jgi:hypothetical protein
MRVELKLSGIDGVLDMLKRLPPEVVSKNGGPVKSSLLKGARVLQKEAALNIARATNALGTDDHESTGLLLSSLIASRGKAPTGGRGERYLVRVKRKTYQRQGKPVTTLKTAHLLEYGSQKQRAEPWLRPAFASKAEESIRTIERELTVAVDKVVRKLGKG